MFLFDIYCTENFYVFAAQRQRKGRIKMVSQEWRQCQPIVSPGTLILMGNSAFALQSVVWPWRLNNGVKHHAKRFHSGVDRRMRRFNLVVIASALVALTILFSSWPFLQ
jgi:hypothetical protein